MKVSKCPPGWGSYKLTIYECYIRDCFSLIYCLANIFGVSFPSVCIRYVPLQMLCHLVYSAWLKYRIKMIKARININLEIPPNRNM